MHIISKVLCAFSVCATVLTSQNAWSSEKERILSGPRGFEDRVLSSVISIQNFGKDDDLVCLKGRLTNFLGKKNYEFTDIDGNSIEVKLDKDCNWSAIHKDQLIEIYGEVERNMFFILVEAKDFTILEQPFSPGSVPSNAIAEHPVEHSASEASGAEQEQSQALNSTEEQQNSTLDEPQVKAHAQDNGDMMLPQVNNARNSTDPQANELSAHDISTVA